MGDKSLLSWIHVKTCYFFLNVYQKEHFSCVLINVV